jgi:hypothetical protein
MAADLAVELWIMRSRPPLTANSGVLNRQAPLQHSRGIGTAQSCGYSLAGARGMFMAHASHALFIAFWLMALSLLLLREGAAFIRFLFHRPLALLIITTVVIAGWVVYTEWRSLDWRGVSYFLFVGFVAFTGLTILWEIHKALRRWTSTRR